MPNSHLHDPYDMIFDEDGLYCVCKVCEQEWVRPQVGGWTPIEKSGLSGHTQVKRSSSQAKKQYFANQTKKKGLNHRGNRK